MKKAASILLLITGIIAILGAVSYLVLGIVFFVLSGTKDAIVQMINEGAIDTTGIKGSVEEVAVVLQGVFIGVGVMFVIFALFSVVAIILAFKARHTDKKALFIMNIVLGVLSATYVGIAGGIFGLIAGDTLD